MQNWNIIYTKIKHKRRTKTSFMLLFSEDFMTVVVLMWYKYGNWDFSSKSDLSYCFEFFKYIIIINFEQKKKKINARKKNETKEE